jgi:hypothetical protein
MAFPHHDGQKECFDLPSPKADQFKWPDHFQIKLTKKLTRAAPKVSNMKQQRHRGVE